jgi:hypothetical protein
MAPKERQKIEIEKTHRDPLLSFHQAVTANCSDFLGTVLIYKDFSRVLPMQGRRLNRSSGSVCSTTELRPLVVSDCTQESIFRTAAEAAPDPSVQVCRTETSRSYWHKCISPCLIFSINQKRRLNCLGRHAADLQQSRLQGGDADRLSSRGGSAGIQDIGQHRPVLLEICWVPGPCLKQDSDVNFVLDQALRWHVSSVNIKLSAIPAQWQWKKEFKGIPKEGGLSFHLAAAGVPARRSRSTCGG